LRRRAVDGRRARRWLAAGLSKPVTGDADNDTPDRTKVTGVQFT
jgi:hypothetical protein